MVRNDGNFTIKNIGYVWKPKLLLVARDYHQLTMKLNPDELDDQNNIIIHPMMTPIPEDQSIPFLEKTALESRAESFFVKGSVFYYLSIINDYFSAERIIITSKKVILDGSGYILLNINNVTPLTSQDFFDKHPVNCHSKYTLRSLMT